MQVLLVFCLVLLQLCLGQDESQANSTDDVSQFPGLSKIVLPPVMHARVVGGELTTIEKLGGYLVAMRYNGEFICGGSLIEDRVVVSAAHCFLGRTQKSRWIVEGGISRLNEQGVKVELLDYVVPAVFDESTMHMDVAVVLLSKPMKGKNIAVIGLCKKHLATGMELTVSGWGLSDPSATHPHIALRTVTVPITKKKDCKTVYRDSLAITNSMFCGGILGQKDACTFDSGGPFVRINAKNEKELCGIVSFGIGCASPKYPGVYTDVNYVKPFILNSLQNFGLPGYEQ